MCCSYKSSARLSHWCRCCSAVTSTSMQWTTWVFLTWRPPSGWLIQPPFCSVSTLSAAVTVSQMWSRSTACRPAFCGVALLAAAELVTVRVRCRSLQKGNAALHYVCERKSHRLVPLLLQKHADTHIRNDVRLLNTQQHEASDESADPNSFFWSSAGRRDTVGHRHQIEVQQHR